MTPGTPDTPPPQAILLGADSPIGLTVLRELGEHGVRVHCIGWDERSLGLHSRHAATRHRRAAGEDPLLAQIDDIGRTTGCRWLLTVGESDIAFLHRHRARLGHVTPILPPPGAFERVLDKQATFEAARRLGIATPGGGRASNVEEARRLAGELGFPLVLKWSNPHRVVKQLAAIGRELDKYTYVYDAGELEQVLQPLLAVGELPMIQEYCPGTGLGQMILLHAGEPVLRFQHRREAEWPPEGGVSAVCRAVPLGEHAALMERSIELLRALEWSGPAMVEYRFDEPTGRYRLMEINGRFWGSQPLAYHAGAHFAWEWYRLESGLGDVAPQAPYRDAVRCRFVVPEVKRLARIWFAPEQIQDRSLRFSRAAELLRFVAGFFRPSTRYYVFSLRDPGPFLADLRGMLARVLRRR